MNEERKNALFLYCTKREYPTHWTLKEFANARRQVRRDVQIGSFFVEEGFLMKRVKITVNGIDSIENGKLLELLKWIKLCKDIMMMIQ